MFEYCNVIIGIVVNAQQTSYVNITYYIWSVIVEEVGTSGGGGITE